MAGGKTTTKTETRRITTLEPRDGQLLTSLEESVVRMHHGVSLRPEARLATNGSNDELMAELLERELAAFEATGRLDELDDIPADAAPRNAKTARIVQELKKKS